MDKTLIIGNWKMYHNMHDASMLLHTLSRQVKSHRNVETVVCPNYLVLQSLSLQINHRIMKLGAQNCYWKDEGAYTGEISASMLRGLVKYVLVGHSERRHVFGEHERDTRHKVQAVVRNNMEAVLCIGETAHERADGETKHVLHDQIVSGLSNVTSEEIEHVTLAYEPVWAIGTGDNANPSDVKEAAAVIRKQVTALFGVKAAKKVRILYGGSVKESTAKQYLSVPDIDGLLIGGASLDAHQFANIVEIAHNNHKQE